MTGPDGERLCEKCGESNPVRAKFCLECGTPFTANADPGETQVDLVDQLPQESGAAGERRNVSVLFADLSGFTAYSEGTDIEDVRAIAHETAERLGEIVERYGGTVDKIIGDCVMAVFGAPAAHEDDPERAVRAALDMQECVAENRERFAGLNLCVGIQTGEAMWAPVGPGGRYTVLGDTVNTAARLQGAAAKGEVIIGLPTYRSVADAIDCDELEPIKAKNKAEPVPAWRAVAVRGGRAVRRAARTPLIGRDDELERLREAWENVRTDRRPFGVTVLGSPGVGKSRLVSALTDGVGNAALVVRGRCLPYGEGITYWPVVEIIQQVAEIQHDDDRETVSRKLGALLEGLYEGRTSLSSEELDELRTMAVALANVIGAPTTPRGTYTATDISRGELHWGLRRILELGSRDVPLILVLEDLHWAEPTLLDLIAFIFESTSEASILGICTARSEFKEIGEKLLTPRKNRRVIEIEALSDEAARTIVTELFGMDELPDGLVSDLLHAAGGNPLYLEEIARMWLEAPADASGAVAVEQMTVPTGLQALIDSRLDTLSPAERRVASHAAVIGDVFWDGAVAHLEDNGHDLDDVLALLESRDLVRTLQSSTVTGQREYAFKHGLIRDAAYARLTKVERATLHERCGSWMAALPSSEMEFAEIVAYHLEQACRVASELSLASAAPPLIPAAQALMRASERAERREGMREAEGFLARAIDLLGTSLPETALELALKRARLLAGLGRYDDAREAMRAVTETAAELDRLDLRCRALVSLTEISVAMGAASEARSSVDEAEQLARQIGEVRLRVEALWNRAQIHDRFDGDETAAEEALQTAIALAEEADDQESVMTARMRLGALFYNAADLAGAQRQFERCIELARERGSLRHQAWVTALLGLIRYHCGPREEAEELFARASDWMARTNDRFMHIQTLMWRSSLVLVGGDTQFALKLLREAQELVQIFGGSLAVKVNRYLAAALARQGRTGEVREILAASREEAPSDDPGAQADVLLIEAFAAAAGGADEEMRRHFAQALPILEGQGDDIELGDARLEFARLLETMGEREAAGDQLDRARELFDRIGAAATVAQIDAESARMRDLEVSGTDAGTLNPTA